MDSVTRAHTFAGRVVLITMVVYAILVLGLGTLASADVFINFEVQNNRGEPADIPVKFFLPPELKESDIFDTDSLSLEYDVNETRYRVIGSELLQPGDKKTYRIQIRDVWRVSDDEQSALIKEIEDGYQQLASVGDPEKTVLLKEKLIQRLNDIVDRQNSKADQVERRMDSYRQYQNDVAMIRHNALSVDYWRSDPAEIEAPGVVRFVIEVQNPADKPVRDIKQEHYLPKEVKPDDIIETEGFEVRYNEERKQSYLYKSEEFQPGETKRYEIGIKDIWHIAEKNIEFYQTRADYALDFLKDSEFLKSAEYLHGRVMEDLNAIRESQEEVKAAEKHIGQYRTNVKRYERAGENLEELEKLVSIFREELEKSKVENVLQKIKTFKSVSAVSDAIFDKKPKENAAWSIITWVLMFVAGITVLALVFWMIRSGKDMNIENNAKGKT